MCGQALDLLIAERAVEACKVLCLGFVGSSVESENPLR